MNLSTRELLYLEDLTKLFESVDKNCTANAQMTGDSQVQSLLRSLSQDHQQWMMSLNALVTNNGTVQ